MEFYSYLNQSSIQVVKHIADKGVKFIENGRFCNNKDVFGFFKHPKFTVCTNNIKDNISPVEYYVNETVLHEAVHYAQTCRGGPLRPKNISLPSNKIQDAKNSVKAYSGAQYIYEKEAYFLEDKPELVLFYIKKYCM